jgi:hypothetical protein
VATSPSTPKTKVGIAKSGAPGTTRRAHGQRVIAVEPISCAQIVIVNWLEELRRRID